MLIQILLVLLSVAKAKSVHLRCVILDRDESTGPMILETALTVDDPQAGHTFKLSAPVTLTWDGAKQKVEWSPEDVQICEGDRTAIILSTSNCEKEAPADDFRLEFRHQQSWENYMTMKVASWKPILVGEYTKVWCYPSAF